jgi:hypothetical protein
VNERTLSGAEALALLDGTTPGPWAASFDAADVMFVTQSCEPHADVATDVDACEADARLMATAPDLAASVAHHEARALRAEAERDALRERYADAVEEAPALAMRVWAVVHGTADMPPLDTPRDADETVDAVCELRAERDALRATIDGRATPPTHAEIEAPMGAHEAMALLDAIDEARVSGDPAARERARARVVAALRGVVAAQTVADACRGALDATTDELHRAMAERDALHRRLDDALADFDSLEDSAAAVVRVGDLADVSRKLRDAITELRDSGRDEWWVKTTEHRAPPSIALRAALAKVTAERDALRATIDGRATPPTHAEIASHEARGGVWLVMDSRGVLSALGEPLATARAERGSGRRWWPLDAECRPCAWPEVTP